MTEAFLIDTNLLVYRYDPRFPAKQAQVTSLLRRLLEEESGHLAHQVIIEFVAATTRPLGGDPPLLDLSDAGREAEELMAQFPVLYPNEAVLRLALRGASAYQLSWFDAHLWAYAEHYGISTILSEDFQHERLYGRVRALNPLLKS